MAHLLKGCQRTFGNFYSRRHNRIVKFLGSVLESGRRRRGHVGVEVNCETVFPRLRDELLLLQHHRPDINIFDELSKSCMIYDVTVCFDVYLDLAHETKIARYTPLIECLKRNGYDDCLLVVCFGSLGSVRRDVWRNVRKVVDDKYAVKDFIRDCSISNLIGANYIWRHRVKKLL